MKINNYISKIVNFIFLLFISCKENENSNFIKLNNEDHFANEHKILFEKGGLYSPGNVKILFVSFLPIAKAAFSIEENKNNLFIKFDYTHYKKMVKNYNQVSLLKVNHLEIINEVKDVINPIFLEYCLLGDLEKNSKEEIIKNLEKARFSKHPDRILFINQLNIIYKLLLADENKYAINHKTVLSLSFSIKECLLFLNYYHQNLGDQSDLIGQFESILIRSKKLISYLKSARTLEHLESLKNRINYLVALKEVFLQVLLQKIEKLKIIEIVKDDLIQKIEKIIENMLSRRKNYFHEMGYEAPPYLSNEAGIRNYIDDLKWKIIGSFYKLSFNKAQLRVEAIQKIADLSITTSQNNFEEGRYPKLNPYSPPPPYKSPPSYKFYKK